MLLLNVIVACVWVVWRNSFTLLDFTIGFVVGFVIIVLTQQVQGQRRYGRQTARILELLGYTLTEMLKANFVLLWLIITPQPTARPGIVAIPLSLQSDAAITLLAYLVTFIPSMLTLDISTDKRTLYLHALHVPDVKKFRRDFKRDMESRVAEVMEAEETRTHV